MAPRLISALLLGAVALRLAARWMPGSVGGDEVPGTGRAGAVAVSSGVPAREASPGPGRESGAGESAARGERGLAVAAAGSEERTARFRERVLAELRRLEPEPEPEAGAPASRLASAEIGPEERGRIDWQYLRDVFSGRISGIPDERKAGISLQQMDALGEIPAIQALREQERFEELRALGFENETIPWPVCLRTGTCRRDPASSP